MFLNDLKGASLPGEGNQAWAPEQQKCCQEWSQTRSEGNCCLEVPGQKLQNKLGEISAGKTWSQTLEILDVP